MKLRAFYGKDMNIVKHPNVSNSVENLTIEETNQVASFLKKKIKFTNSKELTDDENEFIKRHFTSNEKNEVKSIAIFNKPFFMPIFALIILSLAAFFLLNQTGNKDNWESQEKSKNQSNDTEQIESIKSDNTKTNNDKSEEDSQWTCSVCGRKIIGRGYCEGDDGIWRQCEEPYQGQICSAECGRRASGQFNKAASDLINSSNQNQINNNNSEDYYERKREQMRRQGYSEGEINEMRDPNEGDPEIKESAKKVSDAIREQARDNP